MNVKLLYAFFFINWFFLVESVAQPALSTTSKKAVSLYTEADNFRIHGEFDKAIDLLILAITKDKNFEEAYFRLGLTYKNKEDIIQAVKNFEIGLSLAKDLKRRKEYSFELCQNYLKLGKYVQSLDNSNQFLAAEQINKARIDQVTVWQIQAHYGIDHTGDKLDYDYTQLNDSVNSYPNQYFPVLTGDNSELFYTVRYGSGSFENEDIVVAKKDEKGIWQKPTSISDKINSKLQEGACAISADGRQLIFTMCGGVTYGRCDLFESKKVGDEWSQPTNLGLAVNSSDWEGQPSLSADGRILYFSSSRKGGMGGYDIWTSIKDESGKWTKAQNVGKEINTKFDEISPFIHVNNQTLYFSSNGYPGYGGYDIYQSEKLKGAWLVPINLGAPLNDFEDQFSFFVTSNGLLAYFSKADVKNQGFSKIYQTTIPEQRQPKKKSYYVKGVVRDNETGKPLKATIELTDLKKNERVAIIESDSITGSYLFVLGKGDSYSLFVSAKNYLFKTSTFKIDSIERTQPIQLDIELKPIRARASAILNNIFFEFNKFEIKPESFSELLNVTKFLQQNPSLIIEVGGHTDNAGSEDYNVKLSQKRSQSVINFLVEKGIDKSRMQSHGYGSSKPIANNDTDLNRKLNRRIEFLIVK